MNRIYRYYCRLEEAIVGTGFAAIVLLTFVNAILRKFNKPIVYSEDMVLLLFSWTALLGADVAMRYSRLVGMDILTTKLSPKIQKILRVIVNLIIILILLVLIRGGIKIIGINGDRPFNTLGTFGIRYSAVTLALPVGAAAMILTSLIKMVTILKNFKNDQFNIKYDVPGHAPGEENTGDGTDIEFAAENGEAKRL